MVRLTQNICINCPCTNTRLDCLDTAAFVAQLPTRPHAYSAWCGIETKVRRYRALIRDGTSCHPPPTLGGTCTVKLQN